MTEIHEQVKPSSRISRPAEQILSYFVRNPSASDSLEGIARWRLLEEAIYRTVRETEDSLRWLVGEGYLVETAVPHSGHLFRLNAEKRSDAESLLRDFRQTDKQGRGSPDKD